MDLFLYVDTLKQFCYFISSSGIMQFREACYTVVSYARYILLQNYTITIRATFLVTIFDFFSPWALAYKDYFHLKTKQNSAVPDEMAPYKLF